MKKILLMLMFALFVVCVYKKDVKALTGSGTSASPYIVTKGSELKEALSKGTTSWKYIAVTDVTAITETINVPIPPPPDELLLYVELLRLELRLLLLLELLLWLELLWLEPPL